MAASIIAGYHWFGDWGRDTMIAMPGLTLATGRADVAKQILLAFSRYVDAGMLPKQFSRRWWASRNTTPSTRRSGISNSIRQYFEARQDAVTLQKLFPRACFHDRCARYGHALQHSCGSG